MAAAAVALAMAVPGASAQDASRRPGQQPSSSTTSKTQPPPRPTPIAPPVQLPFPPLMTPPAGGLFPKPGDPPFRTHSRMFFPTAIYPPYAIVGAPYQVEAVPPAPPALAPSGWLRLAVTPGSAQVYVDSLFVGAVDEVNARLLQLVAGPHRVEIRSPQYEPLLVDVNVPAYETLTYRGALEPARLPAIAPSRPAAPAVPAATPSVLYVIPGCYAGNVPPRASRLPAGCDITRVRTIGQK